MNKKVKLIQKRLALNISKLTREKFLSLLRKK